ncbi:MAG: Gfo/Idh/MocA family oxidoreductase [Planctomycetales bacterium]
MPQNRREFLHRTGTAIAAGALIPAWMGDLCYGAVNETKAKSDRMVAGAIGVGGQGTGIMMNALKFADVVAICDVDSDHAEKAKERVVKEKADAKPELYGDYRKLLERQDIDIVTIGTPDHWHTKIAIEAMQAGKDVYCEKPLTLTIAEGQQLIKVVKETGKVLQVGTQQQGQKNLTWLPAWRPSERTTRPDPESNGQPASVDAGRRPSPGIEVPKNLDWNTLAGTGTEGRLLQGAVPFSHSAGGEYSGGIVDWGAHHCDIAQWALGMESSGPVSIDGSETVMPKIAGGYNTPKNPKIHYKYENGVDLEIVSGDEFVLIEGDKGRIRINRERIKGAPIEGQDADKSLMDPVAALMDKLYRFGKPGNHMANFIESVKSRSKPIPMWRASIVP